MPLHDVGYREWNEQKTSILTRWWIIAETGILLTFKSKWIKRIMLLAWLPVLYWAGAFFTLEQVVGLNANKQGSFNDAFEELDEEQIIKAFESGDLDIQDLGPALNRARGNQGTKSLVAYRLRDDFGWIPNVDVLAGAIESGDDALIRHTIWSFLLMTFFRYPQAFLILFLVGFIAPGLISRDIRSRAFLLYFSKPIGPLEYIAGKMSILTTFIVAVTTLPALALYVFAVMLSSPELGESVIASTWDIPFRIVISTVFLVIPTTALALMLSSLTQESRFASFAWFAIWALGQGAWLAVTIAQAIRLDKTPFSREVMESSVVQQWSVLSLYNNLGDIQNWVFGFTTIDKAWPGITALGIVTVVSLVVLYRRVNANIRV